MIISGLTKFSLIDYPGKISCIVFTPGCNMRCKFCYNSEFVLPEKIKLIKNSFTLEKDFFTFLETRKGLLDGVSICGGEPTMQKDLKRFCKKIKKMGFFVKLDTNGSNPKVLQELIDDKLVDYIAMDIKHSFEKYSSLTGVEEDLEVYKQSINILINSNIDYEFRTTIIKGYHSENDIKEILNQISGAKNYFMQNYKPGNTLDKNFNGKPFNLKELENFKKICETKVKNTGIRA